MDHQNLLHHLILLRKQVRHQQHLELHGVVAAFILSLSFPLGVPVDFLFDDLLIHRTAVRGDFLRPLVPAVELGARLAARDVDRRPRGAPLVLLVVGDDAERILHLLGGQALLLLVVIIRQVPQRTGLLRHPQVQPHPHQRNRGVALHEHAKAAQEGFHADLRRWADLQKLQRHADLYDTRPLADVRAHLLEVLLLDPVAPLQDGQRRAYAGGAVPRGKPPLQLALERPQVVPFGPRQVRPLPVLLPQPSPRTQVFQPAPEVLDGVRRRGVPPFVA